MLKLAKAWREARAGIRGHPIQLEHRSGEAEASDVARDVRGVALWRTWHPTCASLAFLLETVGSQWRFLRGS